MISLTASFNDAHCERRRLPTLMLRHCSLSVYRVCTDFLAPSANPRLRGKQKNKTKSWISIEQREMFCVVYAL